MDRTIYRDAWSQLKKKYIYINEFCPWDSITLIFTQSVGTWTVEPMKCCRLVGWKGPTNLANISVVYTDLCQVKRKCTFDRYLQFESSESHDCCKMRYALNHSVKKGHLDNHRGRHLDNLWWHHVSAVSAHPLGLSHQWEMSSSLLASWSLQACLGATCVRSVFHLFISYLRELQLSLKLIGA